MVVERQNIITWSLGKEPKPVFMSGEIDRTPGGGLLFVADPNDGFRYSEDEWFANEEAAVERAKAYYTEEGEWQKRRNNHPRQPETQKARPGLLQSGLKQIRYSN